MATGSDRVTSISRVDASANQAGQAESLSAAIVRSIALPVVVLELDLRVRAANDAFCRVMGCSDADLRAGMWLTPELRELLSSAVRERTCVRAGQLARADRHLQVECDLLEHGGETLILVTLEDVTELRAAQSMVASHAADLEQEHRRKDEFLAMLGHELRNPLAALVNGLSLLEHVGCDPKQFEKIHPMMVRQTRRMTVMLDQLLDMSRVSSGKVSLDLQPVDLAEAVRMAIEAVQPMIDAGRHQLVLAVPDQQVVVNGDLIRLVQVIENLLSNAVKYSNEGGMIRLTVDTLDDSAQITVRDAGVGIEPELLPYIFEVFTQGAQSLDRAKGGLGLGLALVRRLVDMHGGHVEAFSPGPGRGSEFVVVLPRLAAQPVDRRSPAARINEARPLRVLVVDDEQDAALTLAELLHSYGHDTQVAFDGHAAIEAAASFEPDVVLLDLGLPDIDGYEVAKQIRAQAKPALRLLRLIAVTGYERDDARLREAGFDDHVIKPRCLERLSTLLTTSR